MNAIKDSIKSGRTVVGTTVTPNVDVSILADAGYDFLLFDTQHSAWEIKQLQPSIQTMRGKQAAPLVRVAANQAYQICFALDSGARGIVVPMVNTREEAEAAVGSLGDGRDPERPGRDQALTTVVRRKVQRGVLPGSTRQERRSISGAGCYFRDHSALSQRCGSTTTVPTLPPASTALCAAAVL